LLLAGCAGAQPPRPRADARTIGQWHVGHRAEEDGGRIVLLVRARKGMVIDYRVAFWRGNAGPLSSVSMARDGRTCSSGSWRSDPDGAVWRAEAGRAAAARAVRARLGEGLAECGASPRVARAALAGFGRAFRTASAWAEKARRATLAEAEAIADEGGDPNAPGEPR
jgi:hypothetical protein